MCTVGVKVVSRQESTCLAAAAGALRYSPP